jgi:hypothetical protein
MWPCRNQQALEEVWTEVKKLKSLRHLADLPSDRKIEKTKKYLVRRNTWLASPNLHLKGCSCRAGMLRF